MQTDDDNELQQLRWRCRRGMLELDLMLNAYLTYGYQQATAKQKQAFYRLLEQADPNLFSWFLGHSVPDDEELRQLVVCIQQCAQQAQSQAKS